MAKKIDIDLEELEALAIKGYSISMICNAIGINRSTAYRNSDINNTIKRGRDQAKQKIVNDLMARSESDLSSTATIFLAKQLKVFEDYYPTSTPKSISEALSKIMSIYKSVASNELSSDKADKLIHYLEIYIKAYETNELTKRLEELENLHNAQ